MLSVQPPTLPRGPRSTLGRVKERLFHPETIAEVGREDAAEELRRMSEEDLATVTKGVPEAQVKAIMAILDTLPNLSERETALHEAAEQVRRGETTGTDEQSSGKRRAM